MGLVAGLISWVFRTEIVSTDPWNYVMTALDFPDHPWNPLGYTRYGMILPLRPLALVWGPAPAIFYALAILASSVLSMSVYLLARRFWGPVAGITAVVLMLSNWIVFFNLSRYYPDIPSMALVMTALACAVAARDRQLWGGRFQDALPLLVGFLLGWSFEARETALFAWPVVVIALWVKGRVVRNAVLTALPILAWAAVDVIVSAVAYGDPLLKLHTFTGQDLSTTTVPSDRAVMDRFIGLPRLDYLTMIPRLILERDVPGGAWFVALGALALLAILVRDTAVRLSTGALILSYLLFVGISGFFDPSHPAGRLDISRYWGQFVPWIALAVAGALHVLIATALGRAHAKERRWVHVLASAVLVAGPVATTAVAVSSSPAFARNGGAPMAGVAAELSSQELSAGASVFTDWRTQRILPIYQRPAFGGAEEWTAAVLPITGARVPRPGDYVLLVATTSSPCDACTNALLPWLKKHQRLPDSWHRVYASQNNGYVLYEVR